MYDFSHTVTPTSLALSAANGDWFETMGRLQVETAALMTRRMIAVLEFPQHLARCRTPEDVIGEQLRFWHTAQHHYIQSLERVSTSVASNAVENFSGETTMTSIAQPEISTNIPAPIRTHGAVGGLNISLRPSAPKQSPAFSKSIELRKNNVDQPDTEAEVAAWLHHK